MRSALLSAALRGSTLVATLAATLMPASHAAAQESARKFAGAILVQAVDTSINPLRAEIVLPAFEVSARGNDDGTVLFVNVPDGLYLLHARHLGHRPEWRFVRVIGDTVRVELILAPAERRNGAARRGFADSRLRDFLRRTTAIPVGTFLTRGEIERQRPRSLLALLERVRDVSIDRSARPPVVRSERAVSAQCALGMLVLVDAVIPTAATLPDVFALAEVPHESRILSALRAERRVAGRAARWDAARPMLEASSLDGADDAAAAARAVAARRAVSAIERIPVSRVAAIEVYPTLAGVPPEFRLVGAECGLVLVWTIGADR